VCPSSLRDFESPTKVALSLILVPDFRFEPQKFGPIAILSPLIAGFSPCQLFFLLPRLCAHDFTPSLPFFPKTTETLLFFLLILLL
jgi:hypothetical protein